MQNVFFLMCGEKLQLVGYWTTSGRAFSLHNYQQVGHLGFKEGWMGFPALGIAEEGGGNVVSKVDCTNSYVSLWSLHVVGFC